MKPRRARGFLFPPEHDVAVPALLLGQIKRLVRALDQVLGGSLFFRNERDDSLTEGDFLVDCRARVRDRQAVDHARHRLSHIDSALKGGPRQNDRELLSCRSLREPPQPGRSFAAQRVRKD